MIKVIRVGYNHIVISGHANYDVWGKDIVCAGVTALSECLVRSIAELTDNNPVCIEADGLLHIKVASPTEATKLLTNSFFKGIENIAEEFPDYVQVSKH